MSVFGVVPGLRIAAPRDAATLRAELREAVAVEDGPTIVRFPTGAVNADLPAVRRVGPVDVLREDDRKDVLLIAVGALGKLGMQAAERIAEQGYGVTVVDPRWVRPVPIELTGLAAAHQVVVTVEDGVRTGGVGEAIAATLRDAGVPAPIHNVGVPVGFHPHGSRGELLTELGLTAQDVARHAIEWVSQRDAVQREAVQP
jgi:1-deoxy-D-xylulose-5-phosphate synthase